MTKILYLVANDAYFLSHRLPVALAAKEKGFNIIVAAKDTGFGKDIEKHGFKFIPLKKLERGGLNPFKDFFALKEILSIYKKETPNIVHHVAMKPVLYGSIAAWFCNVPFVINALTGLGYLFISNAIMAKIIRTGIVFIFKWLFSKKQFCLILQNRDDLKFFKQRMPKASIEMIKGSGVDVDEFKPGTKKQNEDIKIALVARMLWDKGIQEAMHAMRILKNKGIKADLYLYGDPDPENPKSIDVNQLEQWEKEGLCYWKGHVKNIAKIYQGSDIALLPSYREGLPKSLIEAAACGLPIITTDVPGCREVVEEGVNGYLVPLKDHEIMAERLEQLITSEMLRTKLGNKSRQKAEQEFSKSIIVKETFKVYQMPK
jgi:glycosyltransferase involved in cell wall biosynthesis